MFFFFFDGQSHYVCINVYNGDETTFMTEHGKFG
jgi:hypothetical protein